MTGSVSRIFRTSFGIVLNNTLFSSIDGIRFRGKFMLLESQSVNGFFHQWKQLKEAQILNKFQVFENDLCHHLSEN